MPTVKAYKFDKDIVFCELDHMKKDGYCNIKAMPIFMFNEYRELSILKCVEYVNQWIKQRHIDHEMLACIVDNHNEPHIYTRSEFIDICLKANCVVDANGKLKKARESK